MGAYLLSAQSVVSRITGRTRHWPRPLAAYALLHGVWFALYALLGKGFAYAGFPPLYAGEILLSFALVALVGSGRVAALLRTPLGLLMASFTVWQIVCTAPYFDRYRIDTLRDSVIWVYGIFAWVAAGLILRLPGLLRKSTNCFGSFAKVFLIVGPISWLASTYLYDALPHWPGTNVSIPLIKGGEYCVHLAGIFALALQGIFVERWWWMALILADLALAMTVRGGLLAFVVAAGVAILLRPSVRRLVFVAGAGMLLLGFMTVLDIRIVVPTVGRDLSVDQLESSLQSIIGQSDRLDLEGTKRWRLAWWREIEDYTFFGPYFWTGKGYGVNLADSDGFQVGTRDDPLRSPHNSHLTFLARSGVPGFLLWITLQLTWAGLMLLSYFQARRLQAPQWRTVFAWLLSYWVAFMVSAGFDVFLEGPMAGIPFWTIFGIGWGARTLFRTQITSRASSVYAFR
jgi:hypothetical protein